MMSAKTRRLPAVVLVGRPNVGKSTLFNRVVGGRRAIVTAVPGTTRDVLRETVEWQDSSFDLVDTGGLFGASEDPLQVEVAAHGLIAIDAADLIVFLADGRDGVVPADREVAERIRLCPAPAILVVNKIDDRGAEKRIDEFHALGFEPVFRIAAEHGVGVGDLLDEVVSRLPTRGAQPPPPNRDEIAIAIVGRPNAGKSSLVNLFAREDRVLVSDVAGTTRDAIDTVIAWHGQQLRLVDTAGIRRPGQVAQSGHVEVASVALAKRAMARSDVAVVVIDAAHGVTHREAAIAGEAERAGCGVVLAANKWDLMKGGEEGFAARFDEKVRMTLKFAEYAPIVHLSALTGARAPKLLEAVERVARARATHIATPELNRFFTQATDRHQPSSPSRRQFKIQYAAQTGIKPPRFVLFTNTATALHFSYQRFLTNRLRETFGFAGTPIRLKVRARRPVRRGHHLRRKRTP